mgnify:CR=1 FL=1
MLSIHLVTARLCDITPMPAPDGLLEYVVASNGLFVRAESSRLRAVVPIAPAQCAGLYPLVPFVQLKTPRIPAAYLTSVWQSALNAMPNEAAYQFIYDDVDPVPWRCLKPDQTAGVGFVKYANHPDAVIDLHSHGALPAYFSDTDNGDEQGLRFYVVIGNLGEAHSAIRCRVGVYGHHWDVRASTLFSGPGPFTEICNETAIN